MIFTKIYAQVPSSALIRTLVEPERFDTLSKLFAFVANLVIGAGWSLVVIMVAAGFIQYILSQGEKANVEKAQKWLTYTIVGAVGLLFISVVRIILGNLVSGNIAVETVTIGN